MSKILLNGLYIIAILKRQNCISMPQIMNACIRRSDFLCCRFEMQVDPFWSDITPIYPSPDTVWCSTDKNRLKMLCFKTIFEFNGL